jgi:hypothetical protein
MMNSNGNTPPIGRIPRAGSNKFATIFAKHGKSNGAATVNVDGADRVAHEHESSLPDTLVDGLSKRTAPLRAAAGDDQLMSQPPAVITPAKVD